MAKQTAVQWLVMTYNQSQGYIRFDDIEKANKMFEEQIIEAANFLPHDEQNNIKTSEQYYRENYGKSN